jgi:tetratricopeptide (TPR) repeat protein
MIAPQTEQNRGLHGPFLERAAGGDGTNRGIGLGAFLVMRLVDQFRVDTANSGRNALNYQCFSTRSYIADIRPQCETSAMLYEVTRVAQVAIESDDRRLLSPPLLALACHFEDRLSFDEGLDVIETALQLSDGRDAEDEVPESEQLLEKVIEDAKALGDRDAQARGCQDLACTLYHAGRIQEAAPLAFQAYELFEATADKARSLSDTGVMLKALGHYSAARNAFDLVLSGDLTPDVRARTELECLEVSALIGDRLSFERWRQAVNEKYEKLPPDVQMDFELQVGTGLSLFEEHDRAEAPIQRAIKIAEQYGMAERVFFAEGQLAEVRERRAMPNKAFEQSKTRRGQSNGVQNTIDRLEVLAASARG